MVHHQNSPRGLTPRGFEEIEHTADVALQVWGADLAELFANAARGMTSLMVGSDSVPLDRESHFDLAAPDAETLLVSWLGELLYLAERDGLVYGAFDLHVTPTALHGAAWGGPAGESRRAIKAVTFSEMEIRPGERGLETRIVFDV